MSLVLTLVGFGLRQVIGQLTDKLLPEGMNAGSVISCIEQHYRDHSQTLPAALGRANDRAWHALEVALAGDGFCDQVKRLFTSGDDRAFREQVRLFLENSPLPGTLTAVEFRKACLVELQAARKQGLLSSAGLSPQAVAARAAAFRRYADLPDLTAEAHRAMGAMADALPSSCPRLAQLLREPMPGGPPLLAAAFAFFFRREVENDSALAHGLFLDSLGQLSKALDGALVQLERLDATLAATHAAVLDVQVLLQRLEVQGQASSSELVALVSEVLRLLQQQNMQHGAVQPQHSCSIHNEAERRLVKELLARYRALPAEEQTHLPALLNGLGKLQLGSTDFETAQKHFSEAAQFCTAAAGAAEAHFNAYRAALEQRRLDEALAEIGEAARLDSRRFAPFPLERYRPQRILGAGGFGTAFLCRDTKWDDEQVVIKTLHAANLDREGDSMFQEAKILRRLKHPAIIGVHDFGWADAEGKAQPYLVMDYFPGVNLDAFVREHGPLSTEALLSVAGQVARGMQAVHAQKVWHRDLKPANVLVLPEGHAWQVKVIDFGLALRRQTIETSMAGHTPAQSILGTSVAGTLLYAPPEQMGQRPDVPVGPYSDVYAFGKTCCYALFQTTEPKKRHWDKVSAELADLLDRCTDQDVRHRIQNFDGVLQALAALEAKRAVAEQAQREEERRQEEARKRLAEEEAERQRQELQHLQQQGEAKLESFVFQVFQRTGGHPAAEDTAAANRISKEHRLPSERAQATVNKARARWQAECERQRQEAEQRRQAEEQRRAAEEERARQRHEEQRRLEEQKRERQRRETEQRRQEHRQPQPGDFTNTLGMKFVWIPPGTFLMGSPSGEQGRFSDETQHRVTLTKGFYLGVYAVTQKEWQAVMGTNRSHFKGDKRPVERVSWDHCQEFCRKLSEREGKTYRLPTEAEWEYACRAGTTKAYYFGDDPAKLPDYAWFDGNSGDETHPVGQKKPNAWGLYDMHGNVWEWCQDWYGGYPTSDQVDPQGPSEGSDRVYRGGSWRHDPRRCRSADRHRFEPGHRYHNLGCRLALVPSGT